MFEFMYASIARGVLFIRNNPQIFLTLLLLIAIPSAFFISGQQFLKVAKENKEQIEQSRIGLLHDVFVELSQSSIDNPARLQEIIDRLASQNPDIVDFRVLVPEEGKRIVIAALDRDSIGKEDTINSSFYDAVGIQLRDSFIFEVFEGGARHWKAFRAIVNGNNEVIGFLHTNISMANIDASLQSNVQRAYMYLFLITLVIFFLLLRHAKIIDYTVLYRKLQEVDHMKDDFISIAAHELKTPITAIRGYAEMLGAIKGLPSDNKKHIEQIDMSARQLVSLVDDILDVSRIQQGRLSFEAELLDPASLVASAVDSMKPLAAEKNLSLSYTQERQSLVISVDPNRFRQILINIIGNAIKYSRTGTIEIKTYQKRKIFYIRVIDTVIGISAEDQKRLFSKFFRVKSEETERIRGTGLGLWITRQLVLLMKGDISIESIEGVGTHVIVSFPVAEEIKKKE